MGLTSHGIATARAFQESETAGAFSGLAIALNAIATAILAPAIFRLLLTDGSTTGSDVRCNHDGTQTDFTPR